MYTPTYGKVVEGLYSHIWKRGYMCLASASSASASVQCRAFYSVMHRERDLVALAKEVFEALICLCMHDRCF